MTIQVSEKEKEQLRQLARQSGLSLQKFSSRVLKGLTSPIPEESIEDYDNPKRVRASLKKAMKDLAMGRVSSTL